MNILVIGKFYTEGFALHILETLASMGHTVKRFEPGWKSGRLNSHLGHRIDQIGGVLFDMSDGVPTIRAHRMRELWKFVESASLDVAIVCHDFLWPNEVAKLRQLTGAQIAMWFPDALVNFGRGYFMNASYDALFFKDPYIVHVLKNVVSSPVYYLPECFNPVRHKLPTGDIPRPEYSCEITTAGNPHSWRTAFYKHLENYHVKLWGPPPPLWLPTGTVGLMYQGRQVFNEEKARAFLGAKIVVNNLHYGEIWGLNARAFEIAGIGAFQMLDDRPGLAQLFEDGREVVSFRGINDLKEKVEQWLQRDDERVAIALASKRRALSEHTYLHRLDLLLRTLEGRERGFPMPNIRT